jgi:hypothetical protein
MLAHLLFEILVLSLIRFGPLVHPTENRMIPEDTVGRVQNPMILIWEEKTFIA